MTSYRYIGYGTTNSNGVAHLDHDPQGNPINGYVGTGAGEVDVIASTDNPIVEGSIVSQTYEVWDYLCYDEGIIGDKSNSWTASSGLTPVPDDTGTLLSASTTQTYTSTKLLTGDFEATFIATQSGGVRIGFNKASDSTVQTKIITPTIDGTYYYKINRIGSTWRFQYSTDGTTWADRTITVNNITDEDCYFLFSIEVSGSTRSIKYKDLKIYPI